MQLKRKLEPARPLWLVLLVLACIAVEYLAFGLSKMDWSVPMIYGGDGISGVKGISSILRGTDSLLGWPFHQENRYSANYSMVYTLLVSVCGLFTKNVGLVFNLYILVLPIADAAVAYLVLSSLQVRGWLAFLTALTYGFCPYVQQRLGGHMSLAACEFVPLVFLLCIWCTEDQRFNRPGKGFFRYRRNWAALAFAWLIANNGIVYYPYFACFLLCVVALCLLLREKSWKALSAPLVTVAEIAGWLAVSFLPAVLGMLAGTGNTTTAGAERGCTGGEIYSLRISSLLLSPNGYGIPKLAEWINYFRSCLARDAGLLYNENSGGYLGIVGVIGFLFLLVVLFANHDWRKKPVDAEQRLPDRLWLFSRLNVAALLLCTMSGFGSMLAIALQMIRGYNRIGPYFAFLSLLTVALCIEQLLKKLPDGIKKRGLVVLAAAVFAYGFWEQQGFYHPQYEAVQAVWAEDAAFVAQIEEMAGEEAMVYQLPYMKSFENGPVHNMADYTLLRGVLHSDTLRWSYGAAYGGENDLWNRTASEMEPAEMVEELRSKGFAGIYLNRDGYDTEAWQQLEQEICGAAGCEKVLVSESGSLCYIPLQ